MVCLIVTNQRDLTSDYIVRELRRRQLPFFRLNTEIIHQARLSISFDPHRFDVRIGDETLRLGDVRSAYFRRPEPPDSPAPQDGYAHYRRDEWLSALKSIYLYLDDRWFSHPGAILLAEDKPRQLRLAQSLGLSIPETLITNAFDDLRRFASGKTMIGKPLRNAVVRPAGEERVIFTTRLPELSDDDRDGVESVPAIYQREILKANDIRVTVVGDRVFAVAIDSQAKDETETDWRKGAFPDLVHEIINLPDDVSTACVALVNALNLRFGAIDLVKARDGRYWFLECNPNGQWAWIENRTAAPISAAIVDELERIGRS